MIKGIRETRIRQNERTYILSLEVPDREFADEYGDVNEETTHKFISNYLENRGDEGTIQNVIFKEDMGEDMLKISTQLLYVENGHLYH